ncbi:MAG: energy transducer TonB [Sphingobacteriales bacterium]|nr:energy transducer TonB [Sphingobacteriales bacterium]
MKILPALFCCLISMSLYAQKNKSNESFYVYDSNWKPCEIESAQYLCILQKINDSTYQWLNYHFSGPLISIETYRDEKITVLNGYMAYFGIDGQIDSAGYAKNGLRDSTWYFYDDTIAVWMEKKYKNGILVNSTDLNEKRKREVTGEKAAATPEQAETEAGFKGGMTAWIRYLQNKSNYPDRAQQLEKKGTVKIAFVVDTEGRPVQLRVLRSVEYSLDKEALRLINESPKWNPAFQKGRKVKAYRIQPITFS